MLEKRNHSTQLMAAMFPCENGKLDEAIKKIMQFCLHPGFPCVTSTKKYATHTPSLQTANLIINQEATLYLFTCRFAYLSRVDYHYLPPYAVCQDCGYHPFKRKELLNKKISRFFYISYNSVIKIIIHQQRRRRKNFLPCESSFYVKLPASNTTAAFLPEKVMWYIT